MAQLKAFNGGKSMANESTHATENRVQRGFTGVNRSNRGGHIQGPGRGGTSIISPAFSADENSQSSG